MNIEACIHCSNKQIQIHLEEEGPTHQLTRFCQLCGWTQVIHENTPDAALVQEANKMYTQTWWKIFKQGEPLLPWDFESEEEAERVRVAVGADEIRFWTMENDGLLPHPYWMKCGLCQKRVPGQDHDKIIDMLEADELPERCGVCSLSIKEDTHFVVSPEEAAQEAVNEHENGLLPNTPPSNTTDTTGHATGDGQDS